MKTYKHIFLENWMHFIKDDLKKKSLTQICFYGSHDSNTYTIEKSILSDFA